jgi:hypothetical protein
MAKFTEGSSTELVPSEVQKIKSGMDVLAELFEIRSSKGYVSQSQGSNYIAGIKPTKPPIDLSIFTDMLVNDPIISSCVDATVDVSTMAGYDFYSKKDNKSGIKSSQELWEKFKFEFNFDEISDNLVRNISTYGMAYLEMRKTEGGDIRELFVLETPETWIQYDDHGEIKGFVQNQGGKRIAEFAADEVIYFSLKPFGSRVYSLSPFEPIAREYATYTYANVYLQNLFKHMPPRLWYTLKNASSTQRKVFAQNLQIVKQTPGASLISSAEGDSKQGIMDLDAGLTNVMKYLRQQIYGVTRVPPMWLGILEDAGNRGNAEAQIFSFETRIRKIQSKIENGVNLKLLPQLGFKNLVFRFNSFSLKDERTILDNAQKLISMGVKKEKVSEFLSMRGIYVEPKDIQEPTQQFNRDLISMKRPRQDRMAQDMTSNIDKKGVSELSSQKHPDLQQRSIKQEDELYYDQYEQEVLKKGKW